ncbi:cystathionine beta-lyase [Allosphingosinicella flava]|uniref:Cystathionine beta-lyase n=1 Tax=Allosphingosinicella flava TaxID=2771430 RepID=A0A7T2GJG1_9SPHN|nr:cystathionine beta-lyase [Sphingosinicella flava]QPQ55006.1 cystathionine beta-lyase [Sphingosinicella flava]
MSEEESPDIRPDTQLVSGGRRKEWTAGLVNPPVHHASTILFDSVADMRASIGQPHRLHYGRQGTPTTWALEEALTALEPGAAGTRLFPSGLAAIATALMAVVKPGDRLLVPDTVYAPTRAFCDDVLAGLSVETIYYDPCGDIDALLDPSVRAIFLESPGSLTMELQDVPGICARAKALGVVTLLDNTWATPLLFPAIGRGVDFAILACTKYICGHSDAMMGSVTAAPAAWNALQRATRAFGQCAAPDDAYLTLRGLRTLGVRLRRHEESGLKVAHWLADRPEVARVLHPALPDTPGHALWARDFKGASGLFSIVLKTSDDAARARFIDGLRHFGIGFSWGGYESLALPVDLDRIRTATRRADEGLIVRLHIGLEDPDDLIADLARGLARIAP